MRRQELVEATGDEDLLFADGFDDAILGAATRCGQPTIVIYDREKCIEILLAEGRIGGSRFDWHREDAEEHFSNNVEGSWVGPRTPAFLVKPETEET